MTTLSILLIALDGVGLGPPDRSRNPLEAARTPYLSSLLGGARLTADLPPIENDRCSFRPVDANLGVDGEPQSASGQASLMTGINVPRRIGTHYGPKPNRRISALIRRYSLIRRLADLGRRSTLWNAYPPAYFETIRSGHRICSAIPMAFAMADVPLRTDTDLVGKKAISADFTGAGWHSRLGYAHVPVMTPYAAGGHLAQLAAGYDFSVVDHWPTDYAGHKADMDSAVQMVETFDSVLGGIVESPVINNLLVLITSDHGNMEDLGDHGHTHNPVPALLLGAPGPRRDLFPRLHDLTSFAPAILHALA